MDKIIEIMDTTLRDGEQFEGGLFSPAHKLKIAKFLLKELKVDRVEVASARVQPERNSFSKIMRWAWKDKVADRIEILGFVDGHQSVDWVVAGEGQVINLLAKGSYRHCTMHLKKTPEEHISDIQKTVAYALKRGLMVNLYLEDWSQGMKYSRGYVFNMVEKLKGIGIQRLMLADTLGILNPDEVCSMVAEITPLWEGHLDFHGHNDYGLATANALSAIKAGIHGIHVTVNGLGERSGNVPLDEAVVVIHDHTQNRTNVDERKIRQGARLVAVCSERKIPPNKAISGANAFVSTAGIHADGDLKDGLYISKLHPKRFGGEVSHSLGKLSGRASVIMNLKKLRWKLSPKEIDAVVERVVHKGERLRHITTAQFMSIVISVLGRSDMVQFKLGDVEILSRISEKKSFPRETFIRASITFKGQSYQIEGGGTDGLDAFLKALSQFSLKLQSQLQIPKVVYYDTDIPPKDTSHSFVKTSVTWQRSDRSEFVTTAVASDPMMAQIQAAVDAVNLLNQV